MALKISGSLYHIFIHRLDWNTRKKTCKNNLNIKGQHESHYFFSDCFIILLSIYSYNLKKLLHVIDYELFYFFKGIWEYIEATRDMVHVLEKDVQSTKTNVELMNELMSKWSLASLYDRKDGKKDTLLNVEVFIK